MGSREGGLRGQVEERGGADAGTSATTSDKEIHRNPFRPKGYGGTGSSTVLALLDNVQTLPALRRLVSDPAAPVTRPHLLLGQTPTRWEYPVPWVPVGIRLGQRLRSGKLPVSGA